GVHSFYEMMHRGATTLFEYWPGSLTDRSHNHPMFGAVTAYLYDYLLGIRQKEGSKGYESLIIAPVLVDEINHLSGKRVLPKGEVSVSYEKKDEKVYFTITIPEGQNAEFILRETKISLSSGENKFTLDL
ncbi:MAG: alpha-L-rhamnosidase C-terminal domain-containing protein, partial [Clostridia bacterium]|nr:alpha-L-rhamnosidase C-terminal domain-containing protein [Clostridia bacterium]